MLSKDVQVLIARKVYATRYDEAVWGDTEKMLRLKRNVRNKTKSVEFWRSQTAPTYDGMYESECEALEMMKGQLGYLRRKRRRELNLG